MDWPEGSMSERDITQSDIAQNDITQSPTQEKSRLNLAMHLRLYIAGNAPNSQRAIANLKKICQQVYGDEYTDFNPDNLAPENAVAYRCTVDIVDVWQEPSRALKDGILLTPTLRRLMPYPEVTIFGDLSETKAVLMALGLNS